MMQIKIPELSSQTLVCVCLSMSMLHGAQDSLNHGVLKIINWMVFYTEQHKLALSYIHITQQKTKKQIPGDIVLVSVLGNRD